MANVIAGLGPRPALISLGERVGEGLRYGLQDQTYVILPPSARLGR